MKNYLMLLSVFLVSTAFTMEVEKKRLEGNDIRITLHGTKKMGTHEFPCVVIWQ